MCRWKRAGLGGGEGTATGEVRGLETSQEKIKKRRDSGGEEGDSPGARESTNATQQNGPGGGGEPPPPPPPPKKTCHVSGIFRYAP